MAIMHFALLCLLAVLGCGILDGSSNAHPHRDVKLLVVNSNCGSTGCDSMRAFLVPSNRPATPGGGWKITLGVFAAPQTCFTLPNESTFRVIGPTSTSSYTWTPAIEASLGSVRVSESIIPTGASTPQFIPGDAAGWRVTLPGTGAATAELACSP
jgi:hypothetical protein